MIRSVHAFVVVLLTAVVSALGDGRIHSELQDATEAMPRVPTIIVPAMKRAPLIDGVLGKGEWDEAQPIELAWTPGSGKRPERPAQAWLGADRARFYIALESPMEPGQSPRAEVKKHDGNVWEDESFEIFIWPSSSEPRYFQFVGNTLGTTAEIATKIDPLTHQGTNLQRDWNPEWECKVRSFDGRWVAETSIPWAALGITSRGTQCIRLNLCRNMISGQSTQGMSWAALELPQYHRLQDFGVAVIAFDSKRGAKVKLKSTGSLPLDNLLRSKAKSEVVLPPAPYENTFSIGIPEAAFGRGGIEFSASLASLGAEAQAEAYRPLLKTRLKTGAARKLVINGLTPGDYRLKLSLDDGRPVKEVPIYVRERPTEQSISGAIVFEHTDWRNPSVVAAARDVEHTLTPALVLRTVFKEPVLCFDPTDDESITCLADYDGKLYIGSSTQPSMTDTGSVFTYDPEMDLWEKVFQVHEQGLVRMTVHNRQLYIPGYDANDGDWDLGNIYVFDRVKWTEHRTVPRAVHTYDIVGLGNRIYLTADILNELPAGMSYIEARKRNTIEIYGRVVSSADDGKTWREEYRGKQPAQDVGNMAVFKNQIVLNAHNDLVIFDGKTWKPLGLNPKVLFVYDYLVENDALLMATPFGVGKYDGQAFSMTDWFRSDCIRSIVKWGDKRVVLSYRYHAGRHGPGGANYPPMQKDKPIGQGFITVMESDTLLKDRETLSKEKPEWWRQVKSMATKEMCISCLPFEGRIYFGTHPDGRVLVLPVAAEGSLDAAPQSVEGGAYKLWWKAATPPGTSVKLQVRSAATKEDLTKQSFAGPDGAADTYFDTPGRPLTFKAGFMQYRIVLKTDNPAKSPYVKQVALSKEN